MPLPEDRLARLAERLRVDGRVSVASAAAEHGVSEMTIRRDRPRIAVAVYHSPDDWVEIPAWLDGLGLGYRFALELLETEHVLVVPGSSFNVPYRDHFRVTLLPEAREIAEVFRRIERSLSQYADRGGARHVA